MHRTLSCRPLRPAVTSAWHCRPWPIAAGLLLAFGLWHLGQAGYIAAKAELAQYLMQRSWQQTLAGARAVKPWPWADTWPVARLTAADVDLFVLAGADGRALAFGPGQISRFWRVWEQPSARVAFAGEHTDALYPGTIEGALRSGKRAAGQVRDLAAGKSVSIEAAAPAKAAEAPATTVAADGKKKGMFSWFTDLF